MTDKQPVQAAGGTRRKTAPDAIENPTGGQSKGGAYPNPHTGNPHDQGGFMGHGGQSE